MKVALLISGMFRHAEKGIPTLIQKFIDKNEIDVFIDTWKIVKPEKVPNSDQNESDKIIDINIAYTIPNLKTIRIEDNITLGKEYYCELPHYINAVYMYYKIKKCFQLMEDYENENGFKYDIVIKARPDLHYEQADFSLLNQCLDNVLYFSYCQYYHGVSDQFFFGRRDIMEKICYLYDDIPKYYAGKSPIHAENLLHEHWQKTGTKKELVDICRFGLIRKDLIRHQCENIPK